MTVKTSATDLRTGIIRAIAICMSLLLLFTGNAAAVDEETTTASEGTAATASQTTAAETTTDDSLQKMQDKYDDLEKEIAKNEQKLNEVQSSMTSQKQIVSSIYDKIDATQDQINLLSTRVNLLNSDIGSTSEQIKLISGQIGSLSEKINATQKAIDKKNTEMNETYELLKLRLRAMYMAGNGSTLEFLLTAEDFSTLLTRTELLVRVAQHDNDLMSTLNNDVKQLESLSTTLKDSVNEQQSKKSELDAKATVLSNKKTDVQTASSMLKDKQGEIKAQYSEANKKLDSLDKTSDEYVAMIKQQEAQQLEVSAQMESYIKSHGSSTSDKVETPAKDESESGAAGATEEKKDNPYVSDSTVVYSSGMIFPLKCSGVYISSPYGYRTHPTTGEYKLHTGVDFTAGGIYQKQIYAAKDGKVIYAQFQKAYGNFIIIDHGNGLSTCYAHCDSISVAVGDQVLQGQPIGRVGTTGYSTGPHLHFEVRVNGSTTDPMNGYVKLPK